MVLGYMAFSGDLKIETKITKSRQRKAKRAQNDVLELVCGYLGVVLGPSWRHLGAF